MAARFASISALGELGPVAVDASPALVEALQDAEPNVRSRATWALGRVGRGIGEAEAEAISVLLRDPDPDVRYSAVVALGAIGEAARGSLPELIGLRNALQSELGVADVLGPEHTEAAAPTEEALQAVSLLRAVVDAIERVLP